MNNNKNKIILDLCAGTGAWSEPYMKDGYDVRLITLPHNDVKYYRPPKNVYGILAAPPCTMFSLARSTGGYRDFRKALDVVNSCLRIVQECIINAYDDNNYKSFKFWALENPKGYLNKFIGKPAFIFSPWEFGDPYFKNTCLWGHFNEPIKTPGNKPKKFQTKEWGSPKCPDKYKHLELNRSDIRAITPQGFARAFYKANK